MSPPIWVIELAERFWAAAGPPSSYPRDLAEPALFGLGLVIKPVPGLTLAAVRDRLARNDLTCPADEPDRPLRACLFARAGAGFVYLDADDPPDERQFSLSHEVAHFLRDCDAPRRRVAARLGPAGLEVLDGKRPPTPAERLHAVLRDVPLAAHVHLLGRDDDGRPRSDAEREAEAAADRLAFELLAPAELLTSTGREACATSGFGGTGLPACATSGFGGTGLPACAVMDRLRDEFGFPPGPAADYARVLAPDPPTDPFFERIRKSW
ncbi:MAG: hypothetical protein K2X87_14180 [Gemmataceae bacterium]|nr:hypothetical protein [Gemmataceae bacterium]